MMKAICSAPMLFILYSLLNSIFSLTDAQTTDSAVLVTLQSEVETCRRYASTSLKSKT